MLGGVFNKRRIARAEYNVNGRTTMIVPLDRIPVGPFMKFSVKSCATIACRVL